MWDDPLLLRGNFVDAEVWRQLHELTTVCAFSVWAERSTWPSATPWELAASIFAKVFGAHTHWVPVGSRWRGEGERGSLRDEPLLVVD